MEQAYYGFIMNENKIEKIKKLAGKGFKAPQISIRVVMTIGRVEELMAQHNISVARIEEEKR